MLWGNKIAHTEYAAGDNERYAIDGIFEWFENRLLFSCNLKKFKAVPSIGNIKNVLAVIIVQTVTEWLRYSG